MLRKTVGGEEEATEEDNERGAIEGTVLGSNEDECNKTEKDTEYRPIIDGSTPDDGRDCAADVEMTAWEKH